MSGAFIGLGIAVGILMIFSRYRATAPVSISRRIAPRVGEFRLEEVRLGEFRLGEVGSPIRRSTSWAAIQALLGSHGLNLARMLPAATARTTLEKLHKAGRTSGDVSADLARHRIEQLTWLALGLIAGTVWGVWSVLRGSAPLVLVLTVSLGAVIAYLSHERHISALAKRRTAAIDQQFPDVTELLAFSVTAGETPVAALQRVARMSQGVLSAELHQCVRGITSGDTLASALRSLAERTGSRNVERFTDGLVIAMERGTPLGEVLRAQAADARSEQRQHLIELAGKKDVAMLVPVVFFVLPTVIVIALFPAMRGLQSLVP